MHGQCGDGLFHQFITLTINICVQHGGHESLHRAGLSAATDTCYLWDVADIVFTDGFKLMHKACFYNNRCFIR